MTYNFDLDVEGTFTPGRHVFIFDGVTWAIEEEDGGSGYTGTLVITETLATTNTVIGITVGKTAGENLVFGDIVYFEADGKAWKADANAAGKYPAMAMAAGTILANQTGSFLLWGTARNDAWNWTIGGILYLSATAGGITQTPPSNPDDAIQVLGVGHPNSDTIYFKPSVDYITHT